MAQVERGRSTASVIFWCAIVYAGLFLLIDWTDQRWHYFVHLPQVVQDTLRFVYAPLLKLWLLFRS